MVDRRFLTASGREASHEVTDLIWVKGKVEAVEWYHGSLYKWGLRFILRIKVRAQKLRLAPSKSFTRDIDPSSCTYVTTPSSRTLTFTE